MDVEDMELIYDMGKTDINAIHYNPAVDKLFWVEVMSSTRLQ